VKKTEPTEEQQIAILECCIAGGDIFKLRQWARRGVQVVFSVEPLIPAAGHGMLEAVRFLVEEAGADVNQARNDGTTPLFIAAQNSFLSVVQCLGNEFGADVNQALDDGSTPLYIAAQKGYTAICLCLGKELRADVNRAKFDGGTPLFVATQMGTSAYRKVPC
jgi:ankyrin repeat protein